MTRRRSDAMIVAGLALMVMTAADASARPQDKPQATPTVCQKVTLTTGHSTVFSTAFDVRRIAVTDPAIADATPVRLREIC